MEISTALAAVKASFDLAKVGLEARDDAKVKAAIAAMTERLADATMAGLEMAIQLRDLESQVRDLSQTLRDAEDRERKRGSYVLRELRTGTFVRAFEPLPGDKTPAHYQCQVCFDAGKDSVLQRSPSGNLLFCLVNSAHNLKIADDGPLIASSRGRRDDSGWMGSFDPPLHHPPERNTLPGAGARSILRTLPPMAGG